MNRLLLTLSSLLFFYPCHKSLCTSHTCERPIIISHDRPHCLFFAPNMAAFLCYASWMLGKTCFSTLIGRIILKHRSAGKKTLQELSLPASTWCENEKREFCLRSTRLAWKKPENGGGPFLLFLLSPSFLYTSVGFFVHLSHSRTVEGRAV